MQSIVVHYHFTNFILYLSDFLDFDVSKFLPNENDKKPSAVEQSVNNFCKSMGWNKDGTKNKRSLLSRDDEYDSDMEKELKKKLQSDIDKSVTKNLIKKKAIPNYGPEHLAKIKKVCINHLLLRINNKLKTDEIFDILKEYLRRTTIRLTSSSCPLVEILEILVKSSNFFVRPARH